MRPMVLKYEAAVGDDAGGKPAIRRGNRTQKVQVSALMLPAVEVPKSVMLRRAPNRGASVRPEVRKVKGDVEAVWMARPARMAVITAATNQMGRSERPSYGPMSRDRLMARLGLWGQPPRAARVRQMRAPSCDRRRCHARSDTQQSGPAEPRPKAGPWSCRSPAQRRIVSGTGSRSADQSGSEARP